MGILLLRAIGGISYIGFVSDAQLVISNYARLELSY